MTPTGGQVLDKPRGRKPRRTLQWADERDDLYGDSSFGMPPSMCMREACERATPLRVTARLPVSEFVEQG
jgi:hypothetical protein